MDDSFRVRQLPLHLPHVFENHQEQQQPRDQDENHHDITRIRSPGPEPGAALSNQTTHPTTPRQSSSQSLSARTPSGKKLAQDPKTTSTTNDIEIKVSDTPTSNEKAKSRKSTAKKASTQGKKPSRKRGGGYVQDWQEKFGVVPFARDPESGEVLSAICLFCKAFGREEATEEDRKRKRTKSVKYFSAPWRSDHLRKHIETQHTLKYEEFCKADHVTRVSFFKDLCEMDPRKAPPAMTLESRIDSCMKKLKRVKNTLNLQQRALDQVVVELKAVSYTLSQRKFMSSEE